MVVRWLGYQSFFFQCQTDIPGRFSTSRLSDNSIQKSFSTHLADHRIVDLLHFTAEKDTHFESILRKMLVTHHLKGSYRYTGSQRVTAIGGTMFTRSDRQHDLIVGKDRRDRSDTSG